MVERVPEGQTRTAGRHARQRQLIRHGSSQGAGRAVQAVVLDIGETVIDETRIWSAWADRLGVPRLTFLATLGAVIARGGDHREVFDLFRPGFDLAADIAARRAAGEHVDITADDLYPDVRSCVTALVRRGLRVAIAGNQPVQAEAVLRAIGLPVELVASSAGWRISKPSPAFFERICTELELEPAAIAYVGDRPDNDVGPAARAGMLSVFVRRGPWGWILAGRNDPPGADLVIESLADLPAALDGHAGT